MSTNKIYLLAINWEGAISVDSSSWERLDFVHTHTAYAGDDIAHFCGNFAYNEGWRVYAWSTKKQQEAQLSQIIHMGELKLNEIEKLKEGQAHRLDNLVSGGLHD